MTVPTIKPKVVNHGLAKLQRNTMITADDAKEKADGYCAPTYECYIEKEISEASKLGMYYIILTAPQDQKELGHIRKVLKDNGFKVEQTSEYDSYLDKKVVKFLSISWDKQE